MSNKKINETVGEPFEELQIDEMTELQGAGDIDVETTPATPTITIVSEVITGAGASAALSFSVAKTLKGNC